LDVYFPIAEISINLLWILLLGSGVGFASGLFGVGGGFLMTPLLIFIGVPPPVAVATQSNQLVASSVSGMMRYWQRKQVDFKLGGVLLAGGLLGAVGGVQVFARLQQRGHIDVIINICYVVFLGVIASFMLAESARALRRARKGSSRLSTRSRIHHSRFVRSLPLRMRFPRSKLYVSALLPLLIGLFVGLLVALMGVGGGFLMVPAMIYLLGMPASMVPGTSLFQISFITSLVTLLHAVQNQTVDLLLAIALLLGSVIGVQWGARYAPRIKPEYLRLALGLITLTVCLGMVFELVATPAQLFSVEVAR
jgi:uncharacterized protein